MSADPMKTDDLPILKLPGPGPLFKDPVWGMQVAPDSAAGKHEHQGEPIIAAAAMSFSSVSVVGNALRLRRARV